MLLHEMTFMSPCGANLFAYAGGEDDNPACCFMMLSKA